MVTRRLILLACTLAACGDPASHRIAPAEQRAAIAALAAQVDEHYVDPAAAARIAGVLRAGAYDTIDDDAALARRLSADLLKASGDARLRVVMIAPTLPWWRSDDGGIASASIGAADIGYIDIRHFLAPGRSAAPYARAFSTMRAAKTVIVDLRHNDGGDADGLQLLTSYVVDRPIHYANLARRTGAPEARWAFPQLAARPYLEQLMILIGPHTSAEAENFAFAMQAWKRATIIGARSAGVATATKSVAISATLQAEIPDARVTLPLTRTAWIGGLNPDLATSGDALKEARRLILTDRLAHVTTPMGRQALLALLNDL